jgi:ribosome hibernation promoting factor
MKLSVTGRHMAVPGSIRPLIEKKLAPLDRALGDSAVSAQVIVTRERQAIVCELTVHARGDHMLHGVGRHADLDAAVAAAIAKVTVQARRLADRWKKRRKSGPRASTLVAGDVQAAPQTGRVIRSRSYVVKPLSLDDALLALSESALSFLVFRQAATETVAVLYRRPDGHYGLIEPEA